MTTFNPENKKTLTYRECLDPAMKITDAEDAQQYLKSYVKFIEKILKKEPNKDGLTAIEIAKIDIGYWTGYYNSETRARIEKLFFTSHPIFGSIEKNGIPTAEKAFKMGKIFAKKSKIK